MKTLGLIGGTGWVSTIEYYRRINILINEKLGGLDAAKLILYSLNFGDIDRADFEKDPETIWRLIRGAASGLQKAGAECLMLCANTPHMFSDWLAAEIPLPLIHIGEATAGAIKRHGLEKVVLLGTKYTMEMDFYRDKLHASGIDMMVPDKRDREIIHSSIINELLKGVFRDETQKKFLDIIAQMKSRGAQGVVLGCTEIPLLFGPADVDIPVFNTLEIHAQAAVDFALSG